MTCNLSQNSVGNRFSILGLGPSRTTSQTSMPNGSGNSMAWTTATGGNAEGNPKWGSPTGATSATSGSWGASSGAGASAPSDIVVLRNVQPQLEPHVLKNVCLQYGSLASFDIVPSHGAVLLKYESRDDALKAQVSSL